MIMIHMEIRLEIHNTNIEIGKKIVIIVLIGIGVNKIIESRNHCFVIDIGEI